MIRFFFYIFISYFFSIKLSVALEGQCRFEEVYKNGETTSGLLIASNEKIRYEYFDPNLFTIIYSDQKVYLINNKFYEKSELINDSRAHLFKKLASIALIYPNIEENLKFDDLLIDIEKSTNVLFPKRIGIKSNKINLSIYLYDCTSKPINQLFFKINPMFEYPR